MGWSGVKPMKGGDVNQRRVESEDTDPTNNRRFLPRKTTNFDSTALLCIPGVNDEALGVQASFLRVESNARHHYTPATRGFLAVAEYSFRCVWFRLARILSSALPSKTRIREDNGEFGSSCQISRRVKHWQGVIMASSFDALRCTTGQSSCPSRTWSSCSQCPTRYTD